MLLHNDKEKFAQLITDVFNETGVRDPLIEKDYFVTLFLKYLTEREPLLVFKGGTCLSKCFNSINICNDLVEWHNNKIKALDIDLNNKRKTKEGFGAVLAVIPAIFDEKRKYIELTDDFVQKVTDQSRSEIAMLHEPKNIYEEDVQVIVKEGKYYFLPKFELEHKNQV